MIVHLDYHMSNFSSTSKYLIFLKDGLIWKEIDNNKLKNLKHGSFFMAININIYHIQNLFIIHNNFAIKLYKIDTSINNFDVNDYINNFYLDCGLKWLFDDEYKSNYSEFTDLFPSIETV